ncbi:MAG TPA: type VI secretion system baseplate subunit TssF [Gemmatimonadales bacterium]|nr:type VI secretion system baseplate subunit TssF [Gemmatimonadales bacterium]
MRDELLFYYEQELAYLRRMGAAFAEKYPKVASRLLLEPTKCEDPHVERLLEGFAFLAARIHLKLEDDLPEISDALLSILYPHYLRPTPSMSIVEFFLDPEQGKLTTGLRIPRESTLYSRPVAGTPCKFRTCYDTTLWPLSVVTAQWRAPDQLQPPIAPGKAAAAVRLELRCFPDVTFDKLELNTLRLYLNGEGTLVSTLYEVLCNNCVQILIRDSRPGAGPKRSTIVLPSSALRPVGFGPDEGMLPIPRRAMVAYRLLQEYFTFPEKLLFLDLDGFDQVRSAGFGANAEVIFLLSSFERAERRPVLEAGVSQRTFLLGCTPIVNLFTQDSEPIELLPTRFEHPVIADARRRESTRIYAIDEVVAARPGASEALRFEPLYSFRHATDGTKPSTFWYARPRPSEFGQEGDTDLFLTFADFSGRPARPPFETATARVTCFNGDLPSRLPFGDEMGDFTLPGGGPLERIVALLKPTPVIPPVLGKPQLWRLISQLSLNYLSLVDGGAEALQELLRLHNFGDTLAGEKQIQGLLDVKSEPCYTRITGEHGLSFARGHRVRVTLDEDQFAGGSAYLFASVLERFLGLYTALNSFCILAARTPQRRETMREWPPRAGWKTLV